MLIKPIKKIYVVATVFLLPSQIPEKAMRTQLQIFYLDWNELVLFGFQEENYTL